MTIPPLQSDIVEFLAAVTGGRPVETHISALFLGRTEVIKLRKAVRLPFVDFSAVSERKRTALREFELNTPAAPGLYRDVVPIVRRSDGALAFGAPDTADAIDWVVRMARVPREDFLDVMAANGALTPLLLDAVADAVAAYHAALPAGARDAAADAVGAQRDIIRGNADSALAAGLPERQVLDWRDAALAAHAARAQWLRARAAGGFVRRAHGDLHLGNLCLWQGRPVPFDALEFDEALATIDLGYDLAFLLMDLDHRAGRAAANRVMNRYVARCGDADLVTGLPLFLSLRAMVRAHVAAASDRGADAAAYLRRAAEYLSPPTPVLVAIGGLPGSGKSTLARALAPSLGAAPGALILRSDEIRKRRHAAAPEQRLPASAYAESESRAVMADLAAAAAAALAAGHAVIADATFMDPADRAAIAAAAGRASFAGAWLHAPFDVLEARVAARAGDASDADAGVLRRAAGALRSLPDPAADGWLPVDALSEDSALAALGARLS